MQLIPEWHPQWGVLLAWPDAETDWADRLDRVEHTYTELARAVLAREHLLVVCRHHEHERHIRERLAEGGVDCTRLVVVHAPFNDTWARDFGPLVVGDASGLTALDFTFNGWGNKFEAHLDNAINSHLPLAIPRQAHDMVLEGGSLEVNSQGLLLTTRQCLLNPNRNPSINGLVIEQKLKALLGIKEILWLAHGDLEGDDTDAHIDTLARFCDDHTIAYVQCTDQNDSHYTALQAMEQELQALARQYRFRLVPLPMSEPLFHPEEGYRLPATYANFLIINGAVLMPTYECSTDQAALLAMADAFPHHDVIGIPCRPLIEQHGSLHCITMQLPEGVL